MSSKNPLKMLSRNKSQKKVISEAKNIDWYQLISFRESHLLHQYHNTKGGKDQNGVQKQTNLHKLVITR